MGRREVIDSCRKMDEAARVLVEANKTHAQALRLHREGCRHATAVELSRAWTECLGDVEKRRATAWRFCLDCGEMEHGTSYILGQSKPHFQFRWLDKSKIVRREAFGPDTAGCVAMMEVFRERLHDQGRFDEFDEAGVWTGPDTHIMRGED